MAVDRTLLLPVAALLALPCLVDGQGPPAGYYDSVDPTDENTLRATLHAVIDDHTRIPYDAVSTDTWDVLELADEHPTVPGSILDVYKNETYVKQGGGNPFYDREHTWPSSLGFPVDLVSNYPYSDCHHLFLCDGGYNSARSNHPYRFCDPACTEFPTAGGGSGVYPGLSNWDTGFTAFGTWETWVGRRGDCARAILYMDVRYEGGTHGVTGVAEPDLIVTDDEALIVASSTGMNESVAYMGMLSVLLLWHAEDPVDQKEMDRNDVVFMFQGNRNPFIDHPEWVDILWNDGGGPTAAPWINEFHYDNVGGDTGEFIEVAGPAGLDLVGYRLLGYNGNGGGVYDSEDLSGVLPDQGACLGTLSFPFVGLQNGAPDGIALVDPVDNVVEFLSYEGTIVATDGPAFGMTSVDVGVSERGSTAVGDSLQRVGTGAIASDFAWQPPQPDSPGSPNVGQTFSDGCSVVNVYGCGLNPAGSMTVLSGAPSLGSSVTLGIDNPLGTQAAGSLPFLALAFGPAPGFPCGVPLPNFGMASAGASGELLIGVSPPNPFLTLAGPAWTGAGSPAPLPVAIPSTATLIGVSLYGQGLLFDPSPGATVVFGLTEGAELVVGP